MYVVAQRMTQRCSPETYATALAKHFVDTYPRISKAKVGYLHLFLVVFWYHSWRPARASAKPRWDALLASFLFFGFLV